MTARPSDLSRGARLHPPPAKRGSSRWASALGHLPVLVALQDGRASTQRDLARFAKIEQPPMAQMLARMERDGLIRRTGAAATSRSRRSQRRACRSRLPSCSAAIRRRCATLRTTRPGLLTRPIANLDQLAGVHPPPGAPHSIARLIRLLEICPLNTSPAAHLEISRTERVVYMRTLLTGRVFLESPRWRDGCLWVSDWGAHEVLRIEMDGQAEVVARTNSFPMCIEHLPDGRLLIVDLPSAGWRGLRRTERSSLTLI